MAMKKISSDFTFILKYLLPWFLISFLTVGIIISIYNGQILFALLILAIGSVVVGFSKSMLMSLKTVSLDIENKLIIVHGKKNESIPFDDIKEFFKPMIGPLPSIMMVQLNKDYSFGKSFVFLSNEFLMFKDDLDKILKEKIRN